MGSWGAGPIQNDEAVDWLCKLETFLKNTIENGTVDEKIAAMHTITQLHFEPNCDLFPGMKTCPLGYRFPNFEITEFVLKSIEKLLKQKKKNDLEDNQISLLKEYKRKFEYVQAQYYLAPDKETLCKTSIRFPNEEN